ncbi:unnamed protein product [Trichobilharzia szidati]|nr:unnamed protein product [Trichobilharzia szidati]
MESRTWSFCVPVYPINFKQMTQCLLQYVTSYINKFIPDLQGVLVDFDAKTLQIMTEIYHSDSNIPTGLVCGLFLLNPELNHLRVHAKINVNVFRPHLGLEVDAIVSMVKPQFILCRTEISNVMISLPRLSSKLIKKEEEQDFSPSMLKPFDRIKVKLTQVNHNFGSSVLQGEFIKCLSKPLSKYSKKHGNHHEKSTIAESVDVKPVVNKLDADRSFEKNNTSIDGNSSDPINNVDSSCDSVTPKSRKRKISKVEAPSPGAFDIPESKCFVRRNSSDSEIATPALLSKALLKCGQSYQSKQKHSSPIAVKQEPT